MSRTCKEWIRNKLKAKITGSELEVILPNGKMQIDYLKKTGMQ